MYKAITIIRSMVSIYDLILICIRLTWFMGGGQFLLITSSGVSIIGWLINPFVCFFGIEGHVALHRNPGVGYNTLLLQLIPGDLSSACPHRHFHRLSGHSDSRAALSNSYPNACVPSRETVCTISMTVFCITRLWREPVTYLMRHRHANH